MSPVAIGATAAILGVTSSAWADDSADYLGADDWSFTIAPYVWAAGMKGTAATLPPLPPIDVDASFQDVLQNLDIAAMVGIELRYRRFGAYVDIIYTDISADAETPRGILFDDIDVRSEVFIGTFDGAYRVLESEQSFLDLMVGVRAWSVDTTLKLDGGLLADQEIQDNQNWVDPVVGIKGRYFFGHGLFVNTIAHVGGTDADSDFTWDVFGGLGYEFNNTVSAVAGYRHLEVDYESGGFQFDVQMSGPVIGATIHF